MYACLSLNVISLAHSKFNLYVFKLLKQSALTECDNAHGCLMISTQLQHSEHFFATKSYKVQDSIERCPCSVL